MKKVCAIAMGKILIFLGKIVKRGSVLPGNIATKIDKNILHKFKMPKTVIAVTGSSGKGSITNMLATTYRKMGYTVCHNSSGSNLNLGILTTLIENSSLSGKIKSDVVIVEVDERYTKYVFPAIKPQTVVITNITRDQPPRQGNFDMVFKEIKKAITPNMHLILNADDPYLQKFIIGEKNKVTYYGIEKNKYSTNKSKFENLNLTYCPKCNHKLTYDFYHFENIGGYRCENCDFVHPNNDISVTKINYENNSIILNDKTVLNIPFGMLFAIYNVLAAYTTLISLNNDKEDVVNRLNESVEKAKHFNSFEENNRIVYTLNNKNENSTTFNQSLLFVDRDKNCKTIVIGWREISRRYNFNDLSWLYDINFELLSKHKIEKVVCIGPEQYDIAVRLKLANIDTKKIVCFENVEDATYYLKKKTKENIYAILNFDLIDPFTNNMKEDL